MTPIVHGCRAQRRSRRVQVHPFTRADTNTGCHGQRRKGEQRDVAVEDTYLENSDKIEGVSCREIEMWSFAVSL